MVDSVYKNLSSTPANPDAFNREVKTFKDKAHDALKDPSASKVFLEELNSIDPRKDLPRIVEEIKKADSGLAVKFVSKNEEPQHLVITGDPYKNIGLDVSTSALQHEKPVALTYVRNKGWQPEAITNADEIRHQVLAEKYPEQNQQLTDMAANMKLISDALKKKQ
jgi:hypothetical protein